MDFQNNTKYFWISVKVKRLFLSLLFTFFILIYVFYLWYQHKRYIFFIKTILDSKNLGKTNLYLTSKDKRSLICIYIIHNHIIYILFYIHHGNLCKKKRKKKYNKVAFLVAILVFQKTGEYFWLNVGIEFIHKLDLHIFHSVICLLNLVLTQIWNIFWFIDFHGGHLGF